MIMGLQAIGDGRELLKPGEFDQVSITPQIEFDVAHLFSWTLESEVGKMWMPYSPRLILELSSWRSEMFKNGPLVAQNSATQFRAP